MVIAEFTDFDNMYKSIEENRKLLINDLTEENMESLLSNLFVDLYDEIDIRPSCACGKFKSKIYINKMCDNCNTICVDDYLDFRPIVWLEKINLPFLNIGFISLFRSTVNFRGFDTFRWLIDKRYNPVISVDKVKVLLERLRALPNFDRDYAYVLNNMELILGTIVTIMDVKKSYEVGILLDLYKNQSNKVLCNYIPILNKNFIINERTNKGVYISNYNTLISDLTIMFLKYMGEPDKVDTIIGKVLYRLSLLTDTVIKNLSSHSGISRKHLFGMRGHFTFRTVIVPIVGKHQYDTIQIPYAVAITLLRPHLINIMVNRFGLNYKDVVNMLVPTQFSETVYSAIEILIDESDNGLPVMVQRNPSQNNASILLLYIRYVFKDIKNYSMAISNLVVTFMNGDYDGDELNVTLLNDKELERKLQVFKPFIPVFSLGFGVGDLFGKVNLSETAIPTFANRIRSNYGKHICTK
jgi:hypothetical protein